VIRRPRATVATAITIVVAVVLSGCKAAVPAATLTPGQVFVTTVRTVEPSATALFTDDALVAIGQGFCAGLAGPSEAREQALVEAIAAEASGHFGEPQFDLASVIEGAAPAALCPAASTASSGALPSQPNGSAAAATRPAISIAPMDPAPLRKGVEDAIQATLASQPSAIAAVRQVHFGDGRLTIEVDAAAATVSQESAVSFSVIRFLGDPGNGLVTLPPLLRALLADGPHFAVAVTVHGARTATSVTTFETLKGVPTLSEADWATASGLLLH
jgi:hypothetical protein